MWSSSQRFDKVSVSGKWQAIHNFDRPIVGRIQLVKLLGTKLPELGPSIVPIVDVVDGHLGLGVGEVKLLAYRIILVNIFGCLHLDV